MAAERCPISKQTLIAFSHPSHRRGSAVRYFHVCGHLANASFQYWQTTSRQQTTLRLMLLVSSISTRCPAATRAASSASAVPSQQPRPPFGIASVSSVNRVTLLMRDQSSTRSSRSCCPRLIDRQGYGSTSGTSFNCSTSYCTAQLFRRHLSEPSPACGHLAQPRPHSTALAPLEVAQPSTIGSIVVI
ncbi:hypothetical protein TRVL_07938 [Trypanosoma vivax]|nr:hypothetical protein TRVL_07938 [Trypanosoma vivax]